MFLLCSNPQNRINFNSHGHVVQWMKMLNKNSLLSLIEVEGSILTTSDTKNKIKIT